MKFGLVIALAICLPASSVLAQQAKDMSAAPAPVPECDEAITVFQDVSRIGRKDKAAKNMTGRHREMARSGWRFVDMEVYTENGDLEGFYLSYHRAVPCPPPEQD